MARYYLRVKKTGMEYPIDVKTIFLLRVLPQISLILYGTIVALILAPIVALSGQSWYLLMAALAVAYFFEMACWIAKKTSLGQIILAALSIVAYPKFMDIVKDTLYFERATVDKMPDKVNMVVEVNRDIYDNIGCTFVSRKSSRRAVGA